jgi:hypothetical protein
MSDPERAANDEPPPEASGRTCQILGCTGSDLRLSVDIFVMADVSWMGVDASAGSILSIELAGFVEGDAGPGVLRRWDERGACVDLVMGVLDDQPCAVIEDEEHQIILVLER